MEKKIAETMEYMVIKHAGQKYGDMPYFVHPLDVYGMVVLTFGGRENQLFQETCQVALLHDVIEDCDVTYTELKEKFGASVARPVEILSRKEGESYDDMITRIIASGDICALRVKYCDNLVNMRGDMSHMTTARRNSLSARYEKSIQRLSDVLGFEVNEYS